MANDTSSQDNKYFAQPQNRVVEVLEDFLPQYINIDQLPISIVAEGVGLKGVFGQNLLLSFVYMKPHSVAAIHSHPEEQIGLVLEGEYEFELNGVRKLIGKGDVYIVPPNVPHGAITHDKACLALDIFAPPRSGYREMLENTHKVMTFD
ncbi:cupin domain-containing protein [Sulfobacillus thermosulfidooxidans]|uniref:cupin domain-containing protein n=1 Tax=Sulfobacillus thermosulfidooxidans TaxID=28034 RepID=UPI0006B4BF10|nr:cupin domain-containing protein [Sulfobacillus thermosulfidooxidans]